jgi:methionyl-tRNA formyltransferase
MRLVFAGTPEFAKVALAALLDAGHEIALALTQPDRPSGRGMRTVASPVKQLATARGIATFQPRTLKEPSALARLASARPEALVIAAYGLILPPPVLALPRYGAINIHASLLPRWRGAAPVQRALLAGDEESGITIMQMDEGVDTGPILAQRALPIGPDEDAASLHARLAALGAEMIVAHLENTGAGHVMAHAQPAQGVTHARKIEKAETSIDWSRTAIEIERAVRAFRPAPGARATLRGETIKIWRAAPRRGQGEPGAVLSTSGDGVLIACSEGALAVHELQRSGGKRLDAAAFLRGFPISPGERFSRPAD